MFSDPQAFGLARARSTILSWHLISQQELPQTPHPHTSRHPFLESGALLGKHGGIPANKSVISW
jgi:hypothetical protein